MRRTPLPSLPARRAARLTLGLAALAASPLGAQGVPPAQPPATEPTPPASPASLPPAADAARPPGARTVFLPVLGAAPETGLQFGATALRVVQPPDARPTTLQLYAIATARRQVRAFAELDRWTRQNDWRLLARVEWQRFPLPFYGIGERAPATAKEVYTPQGVLAAATVQRRVAGPLYALGGWRWQDLAVVRTEPNGVIARGGVVGSRGARLGQLVAGALWDTRDDVFTPYRGAFVQATLALADARTGSAFDFRRWVVDARRYVGLGGRRVLAVQGVVEGTQGVGPFDQLSLVGGPAYLRGYERGRFRDAWLAAAQAEYRAPVGRTPWAWALFGGAGRVGPSLGRALDHGRTLPTYGVGVRRFVFAGSRTSVRVDYARGTDGQTGFYVQLNEAF